MMTAMTPNTARWPRRFTRPVALSLAFATAVAGMPAEAQAPQGGPKLPVIRDAETEQLLREYTQPILRAAGLAKQNIRIVIINDRSFNAFVADGHRIFINAGALMESETPNQIIGVIAHEAGHIAGGHLSRLREQISKAETQMIVGMLLGVGAMVAGASSRNVGGNPGLAAMTLPQEMVKRSLLAYVRTQEDAADRAAVKFLNATHQSAKGMSDTFKRFADQSLFLSRGADPYLQSHPMPAERVANLSELAKTNPYWDKKDSATLQQRHDLMRAKLYGFIDRPDAVLRRYPMQDNSLAARYARAIAGYRAAGVRASLSQIDDLIKTQPGNPYFYELKGQALMESGRAAEAIAPLRRAAQKAPSPLLIQAMLGQAMVATNDPKLTKEAVALLKRVVTREPELTEALTQLAMAYGRTGSLANADLTSAQAAVMRGDIRTARLLAERAKKRFPVGSPGWIKADDIVGMKLPASTGAPR